MHADSSAGESTNIITLVHAKAEMRHSADASVGSAVRSWKALHWDISMCLMQARGQRRSAPNLEGFLNLSSQVVKVGLHDELAVYELQVPLALLYRKARLPLAVDHVNAQRSWQIHLQRTVQRPRHTIQKLRRY